jgi:hypothetical protein
MSESPPNSSEPTLPSQPPPQRQITNAGSCTLRLENLEHLSPAAKIELMHSLAEDICATFICIARHTEAGTLESKHTRVIDNVIKTIRDTDVERRIFLERKVRRLRKERHLLRKMHGTVVEQADGLARGYRNKVLDLTQLLREARGEIVQLRGERDVLWNCVRKRDLNGDTGEVTEVTGVNGVCGNGVGNREVEETGDVVMDVKK